MRIVVLIIGPALALFCLALFLMWVRLPAPLPAAFSRGRILMSAILVGVGVVAYFIAVGSYAISRVTHGASAWERVFSERALVPSRYAVVGRQYAGRIDGREVHVVFVPWRPPQPALLSITVASTHSGQGGLGIHVPIRGANQSAMPHDIPALSHLCVLTSTPVWMDAFMSYLPVSEVVAALLPPDTKGGLRELYVDPGAVRLRWHPSSDVREEDVRAALRHLLRCAELAEHVKGTKVHDAESGGVNTSPHDALGTIPERDGGECAGGDHWQGMRESP